MPERLLEVSHLKQYFPVAGSNKVVKAVDDVSFFINKGETFGLVGESGCGKTTTGRSILRLTEPTGGSITYGGEVIFDAEKKIKKNMLPYRRKMQIVFQDPYASLDPRMTVEDIVGEAIDIHKLCASKAERREKILSLLSKVGLNSEHANRYPHEFSGGQRQRIGIARALAVDPEFIAHDLSIVNHISSRIGVMYLGHLVELADSDTITFHSLHPYTKSLISAVPIADPKVARASHRIILSGDVPSPVNPPSGCPFRTRCPYADGLCAEKKPEFKEVESGHFAACHHLDRVN